jgi:serine protease inhibitor
MSRRDHDRWIVAAGAIALIVAGLLAGCGDEGGTSGNGPSPEGPMIPASGSVPPAVEAAKTADTPVDPTIVTADNTFGLDLLNALVQSGTGKNTAIAPISVAMTLQIVYNGAGGTTQQAMAQTLQLGSLSVQQLNSDNAALLASLLDPDPKVTLTIANSLWIKAGANLVPAFVTADQTYYGAQTGSLAGAPANINTWVDTQTQGLIPQILSPDGNYSSDVAMLVNAVYFKGQWTNGFNAAQTTPQPFTLADGTQASVQTMQQTNGFPYYQGAQFQAVSLPYGQGRMSLVVLLPNAGVDLGSFVAGITPADIDSWVSQMSTTNIALTLPRFTTTFAATLIPPLTTLGMGVAFSQYQADLNGIYPGAYISLVQHTTVVEVDESGTVAAGGTVVGIGVVVVGPQAIEVQVDRPFFYAIRDNQTGELLFIGVMMNPNGG